MIEKHFHHWDYHAVQELEGMCRSIPILPRDSAMSFFKEAGRLTKREVKVVERPGGAVFESLMGVVSASDRKDFSVTCELDSGNAADGVLMLETFDSVIGVLFCVVRISEKSFLTHAFIESDKPAIKGLRAGPAKESRRTKPAEAGGERSFWQQLFGK